MAGKEETKRVITFELNQKQADTLSEIVAKSNLKGRSVDEAAKEIVLASIIQGKQQLVAQELQG